MKKQRKINKLLVKRIALGSLVIIGIFVCGALAGKAFIPSYINEEYLRRIILNGDSKVTDWQNVFPRRKISNDANNISSLPIIQADINTAESWSSLQYSKDGRSATIGPSVQEFLAGSDTDSLIVVRNNQIVYESYLQGTNASTVRTSMSTAKSFLSALVGIAIKEHQIKSIDEPVLRYLPELNGNIAANMTIRHLLTMSAGNTYEGSGGLTGDDTKTYWSPDLRRIALDYFRSAEEPGNHMHYNDFQPQVLGMILERATGTSLSQYMEEKIWKPAGMEYAASWSIDSKGHGFEQSAVGINAISRDFARFGLIFLNNGAWNGRQIIPENWIQASTHMQPQPEQYFIGWHDSSTYGYYWWGNQRADGAYDYYARGKHGQFIYISPATNTVIVRTGASTGRIQDWPGLFEQMTLTQ